MESGEGVATVPTTAAPTAAPSAVPSAHISTTTPAPAPAAPQAVKAPAAKAPSEPMSFIPNKALKKVPRLPKSPFNQDMLRYLPPVDRQLFTQFGLGEKEKPTFDLVHIAFEHYALAHPENVAVEDFAHKVTYEELDRQSNCLAATLRSRGVNSGSRVCLLVERSIFMVIGILGILKAGGAYVPLDGNVVADKTLNHALKDSGSSLALIQRKFIERISSTPILCLEDVIHENHIETHCIKPENTSKTTDSAYIIYTSGKCD